MRVFAGVVVVAAVGVSALAVARIGPFADPVTLVVGDSVTNLSRIEIEETTGAKVVAQNRQTWALMAPRVRGAMSMMGTTPDRVGVLLGYNDVLLDAQDLGATEAVLDEFSDVECVVVLTLPKLFNRDVAAYNAQVQAIVDGLPNTMTDDGWANVINDNLAVGADLVEADLVHPKKGRAKQMLADSYRDAFDRHC